jgi:hypothetical protein
MYPSNRMDRVIAAVVLLLLLLLLLLLGCWRSTALPAVLQLLL